MLPVKKNWRKISTMRKTKTNKQTRLCEILQFHLEGLMRIFWVCYRCWGQAQRVKHEGSLSMSHYFSLVIHLTFIPRSILLLVEITFKGNFLVLMRSPGKSFCKMLCKRHIANGKNQPCFWLKLKRSKWFMLLHLLHHLKKQSIILELVQLIANEICDCRIDREYSNHSKIFLIWSSVQTDDLPRRGAP